MPQMLGRSRKGERERLSTILYAVYFRIYVFVLNTSPQFYRILLRFFRIACDLRFESCSLPQRTVGRGPHRVEISLVFKEFKITSFG